MIKGYAVARVQRFNDPVFSSGFLPYLLKPPWMKEHKISKFTSMTFSGGPVARLVRVLMAYALESWIF